ncbi:MAG: nucleotide disphospho-sugar-binding domain-containing protein [Caulobacteraceae bacterium]
MKILFAATPVPGHVNPLLSIVRAAVARGDEALFATVEHLFPLVEAAGAQAIPFAPGADLDFRRMEELFPERASLPPGPAVLRFNLERIFIDPMPAQAETLRQAIELHAPDVIVAGAFFFGITPLLLDQRRPRPPIVACNVTFLSLDRPDGAPIGLGLPPARDSDERDRYAAIAAGVNAAVIHPVEEHFNRTLAAMDLSPPTPVSFWSSRVHLPDAFLQPGAPEFEYDFGPLPPTVRFIGAFAPPSSLAPTPPSWWGELDGGRRVVLVTQGTVANANFGELVEPAIAALADRDDLLVIVTTGGRPVTDVKGPLPDNVRIATFLDYEALLPRIDLLVTNGGYGSVSLALRAGVPIVAAGRTEDKAEVGARVAWSGVGVEIPSQTPDMAALRDAITQVLEAPRYREQARAMAVRFAELNAQQIALEVIDGLVAGAS